jgi:hypothetical protein
MSQPELLAKVIRVLDRLGIEYMITGSIAGVASTETLIVSRRNVDSSILLFFYIRL